MIAQKPPRPNTIQLKLSDRRFKNFLFAARKKLRNWALQHTAVTLWGGEARAPPLRGFWKISTGFKTITWHYWTLWFNKIYSMKFSVILCCLHTSYALSNWLVFHYDFICLLHGTVAINNMVTHYAYESTHPPVWHNSEFALTVVYSLWYNARSLEVGI